MANIASDVTSVSSHLTQSENTEEVSEEKGECISLPGDGVKDEYKWHGCVLFELVSG